MQLGGDGTGLRRRRGERVGVVTGLRRGATATNQRRETEDAGYVVSGRLDIEIGGVWHSLGEGDSFRFGNKTYRWRNPGSVPAVVIWVVSPPVY